jgi:hypothetical protein
LNVGCLQALGAANNLEFNSLPLVEGAIAIRLNSGEMDENVLASLALDEAKAFAGVKPLHCTLFLHRCVPFREKSYLMHSFPVTLWEAGRLSLILQDTAEAGGKQKKGRKLKPATLSKQKAKQEQQTQL